MEPIILPRISDQKPLVSVISITYNHESYIRDCLEGFLMQKTDFPVEVLIHDDASTDHTADIIREYYEKRPDLFHVILERENQYSQKKNVSTPLYEQAQGKYITICEGDDCWIDPLKLQKQFDFLEQNSDCSMCFSRVEIKSQIKKAFKIHFKTGFLTSYDILKDWSIPTCTVFFRADILSEYLRIRKDPRFIYGDIIISLVSAKHGKVFGFDEVTSVYNRHSGGITFKRLPWQQYYNHFKALYEYFPETGDTPKRKQIHFLYRSLLLKILKFKCFDSDFYKLLSTLMRIRPISLHFHEYLFIIKYCFNL